MFITYKLRNKIFYKIRRLNGTFWHVPQEEIFKKYDVRFQEIYDSNYREYSRQELK